MSAIAGSRDLLGWGSDATPWFGSNPTDRPISVLGITIPAGKMIFFPLANYWDDWPCTNSPDFKPAPGQTLEEFLTADVAVYVGGQQAKVEFKGLAPGFPG